MACFHPVQAWKPLPFSARKKLFFRQVQGAGEAILVPCGQCIGCRVGKSDEWRTRLYHEAQAHERSSFLTLTYAPEHLPEDGAVSVRALQLFMKRLRKGLGQERVRFFACGEYGEGLARPHYHVILFGKEFADQYPWEKTRSGHVLYRSAEAERYWPFGHVKIGTVTPSSAAYVARYCVKKVNGERAESHYTRVDPLTGEVRRLAPEFLTMSRRPGIGADWYERHARDAFPSDFVIVEGSKKPVPRYYERKLAEDDLKAIKQKRTEAAEQHQANNTPERLAVREEVAQLRLNRLKRDLENDQ